VRRPILIASALWVLALAPSASAVTTASVSGTTLSAQGSTGPDQITLTLPGGDGITPDPVTGVPLPPPDPNTAQYEVRDPAGVTPQAGCTGVGTEISPGVFAQANCSRAGQPFGSFTVRIDSGDGTDYVQAFMPIQAFGDLVFLSGGTGDDAIFGSENDEVISGDAGNDLMDGGAGGDFMSGGTLLSHVPSFEGAVSQPASYSPGPGAGCDRIFGGGFDDQLADGDVDTGTAAPEPANCTALLNTDLVDGGVCPGEPLPAGVPAPAGVTTCPLLAANVDSPEDHDAYMLAHRTRDLTIDVLILTPTQGAPGENEHIRRIEALWGGEGNDKLYGRDGHFGDDSLRGNGGNDYLETRGGDDELLGGDGQDTMIGGQGADVMNPGGHITSQTATGTVMVSDGPDYMDGGENSVIVGGHAVSDLVTYEGRSDPLSIDMTQPNTLGAPGEGDTIIGVEDVMGGHSDDVIIGDALQNLISGDPQPPIVNVPPDPPLPPGPPGGHFGNDHITTRDTGPDTIDCTEGAGDVSVADALDAVINCENLQRPETPKPTATQSPNSAPAKIKISGQRSAGRVRVARDGSFALRRHVITCPSGAACAVTTSADARLSGAVARRARLTTNATRSKKSRTYKLGSAKYTIKAGRKAAARSRLTKKGLRGLTRLKTIKTTVTVRVVRAAKTTTKQVTVTLLAPNKAKTKAKKAAATPQASKRRGRDA
jgi:Ca2+-binding RTX toxin-like protein